MNDAHQPGDQFVQSLARGLEVITCFDADHARMSLTQVAERTGFSRATARRFLHTLVVLGYMRTDGKAFELTPQVLRLGNAYLSGLGLPQVAQPHLEALSELVGESTSAAVLDDTEIVYVARVAVRSIMSVAITVGTRFPAFSTSMGRVLLAGVAPDDLDRFFAVADLTPRTPQSLHDEASLRAELDAVREQGWCLVDQELERGLTSMAAPVTGKHGGVVAAVNVSFSHLDYAPALDDARRPLLDCAAAISADLHVIS